VFVGCSSKLESAVQRDINSQVHNQTNAIASCYAKALERNKALQGRMTLTFHVSERGEFEQVNVIQNEVQDPKLRRCVVQRTAHLSITRGPDRPVLVTYPLTFQGASRR
jgi:hypothetical protein